MRRIWKIAQSHYYVSAIIVIRKSFAGLCLCHCSELQGKPYIYIYSEQFSYLYAFRSFRTETFPYRPIHVHLYIIYISLFVNTKACCTYELRIRRVFFFILFVFRIFHIEINRTQHSARLNESTKRWGTYTDGSVCVYIYVQYAERWDQLILFSHATRVLYFRNKGNI